MATKTTKKEGRRDNSTLMRVPIEAYEAVKAVAQVERRNMNTQLEIIVEAGLEALGFSEVLTAVRKAKAESAA